MSHGMGLPRVQGSNVLPSGHFLSCCILLLSIKVKAKVPTAGKQAFSVVHVYLSLAALGDRSESVVVSVNVGSSPV